jgi:hypothetical protein
MRLGLLAAALLLAGCGGGGGPKYVPVAGRVVLNGQPLANASVVFQPLASGGNVNPGTGSYAKTDAAGRFTLTVMGKEVAGAVVGKHHVAVTTGGSDEPAVDPNFPDAPAKGRRTVPPQTYSLEVEVPPAGLTDAVLDVKPK